MAKTRKARKPNARAADVDISLTHYKQIRNRCNQLKRNAKIKYFCSSEHSNHANANLWEKLRKSGAEVDQVNSSADNYTYLQYINHSWLCPTKLEYVLVRPVPRITSPKPAADYRPIRILPALSKALEYLVHTPVLKYITDNNLLDPFQSGFRPSHRTFNALLNVTDYLK
ncbi:hypothetical protein PR048_018961 [Dryococelus australis]|uniref:Reverse transcriptase domain-containing protein n=1 Tax=Dryococelus australis TaxID=614101 RepID=A0ABQ9H248_9NEOP|nr:hypothetical protein PR048_018961 [Dryococelus australis]